MPTSKTRRDVQLPERLHAEVKQQASERQMAVNVLVALAVREWLDRQKPAAH